jgi:hypothetical protein
LAVVGVLELHLEYPAAVLLAARPVAQSPPEAAVVVIWEPVARLRAEWLALAVVAAAPGCRPQAAPAALVLLEATHITAGAVEVVVRALLETDSTAGFPDIRLSAAVVVGALLQTDLPRPAGRRPVAAGPVGPLRMRLLLVMGPLRLPIQVEVVVAVGLG